MKDMEKLLRALAEVDDEIDFANEKSLIGDEILDSMMLTQVIAALDVAFGIHIDTGDIEPENFESAEAMLALVERYVRKV